MGILKPPKSENLECPVWVQLREGMVVIIEANKQVKFFVGRSLTLHIFCVSCMLISCA